MLRGRFIIGVLLLICALYMYTQVSLSYPDTIHSLYKKFGIDSFNVVHDQIGLTPSQLRLTVDACNNGIGDIFNLQNECMKIQTVYYSPWILGIISIVFLAKSRSHYYGSRTSTYH